jgi:serine/threonine-protein kinase
MPTAVTQATGPTAIAPPDSETKPPTPKWWDEAGTGQFGTGQFGNGQVGTGQFGNGQFAGGGRDDGNSHTLVVSREDGGRYGDDREREPFLQRWLFSPRLLVIALVLVLGVVFGLGGWWLTAGRYAQVPTLTGDSVKQATAVLTADGFKVGASTQANSNGVPKSQVLGTKPDGRASKGAVIALLISAGPFTSVVPVVKGDTLSVAEASLQRVHLVPVTQQVASGSPAGTVLGTNPAAGTSWPQTKTVTIMIAAAAPLPNFVGQNVQTAEQWASQHGVTLVQQQDNTSQDPVGTVTSQTPAQGTTYTQGESVTVQVSTGPQEVNVPSPIGMSVAQATSTLQTAGFQVQVKTYGPFDKVFDFSPVGQAPRGSTITLDVGYLRRHTLG